ncbi:fasciclin domain-containing protein [Allomuricauda sp. d1]|uniref:fasciclin domain-containing protein n=1 Tax=Allomuricauda sp. d1 TaxID=3136725 RepID=UPI0031E09123
MKTLNNLKTFLVAIALITSSYSFAQEEDMRKAEMSADKEMADKTMTEVGDAAMSSDNNIVENAALSKDHTTLVTAVKAAGLVETLQGEGPFTVFAPTNAAFEKLPEGAVENLLKEENKEDLTGILTYHVVAGKLMAKDVLAAIEAGEGKAELTTVNGATLYAKLHEGNVKLKDASGNYAIVTIADVESSNGVVHVIDGVVMPQAEEEEEEMEEK